MVQKLTKGAEDKVIGAVTGIYGCGKSTVARLFEELGALRVDADLLAHETLLRGSDAFDRLSLIFPEAIDAGTGDFDRGRLAKIVFEDAGRRKQLEAIVHPYVFQRIAEEVAETGQAAVVLEIPLLFETGYDRFCSPNIVVNTDPEIILKRLGEKGIDRQTIEKRWRAQFSLEEKLKRADIVIDNSKSLDETKRQVEDIWKNTFLKGAIQNHAKRKNR